MACPLLLLLLFLTLLATQSASATDKCIVVNETMAKLPFPESIGIAHDPFSCVTFCKAAALLDISTFYTLKVS